MAGNSLGNCAKARPKVLPELTSARMAAISWPCLSWSASSAKADKARSMGRPLPTRLASWRVHTARWLLLNTRPGLIGLCHQGKADSASLPLPEAIASTSRGTSDCARSWARAVFRLSASRVPLRVLPLVCRASKR